MLVLVVLVVDDVLLLVTHVHVLVIQPVLGLPRHLVLLLQPPTCVGEPTTNLQTNNIKFLLIAAAGLLQCVVHQWTKNHNIFLSKIQYLWKNHLCVVENLINVYELCLTVKVRPQNCLINAVLVSACQKVFIYVPRRLVPDTFRCMAVYVQGSKSLWFTAGKCMN